jgi:hypothetical protein
MPFENEEEIESPHQSSTTFLVTFGDVSTIHASEHCRVRFDSGGVRSNVKMDKLILITWDEKQKRPTAAATTAPVQQSILDIQYWKIQHCQPTHPIVLYISQPVVSALRNIMSSQTGMD